MSFGALILGFLVSSALALLILKRFRVTDNVFALVGVFALCMFSLSYAVGIAAGVVGMGYPKQSKGFADGDCEVEWDGRSNRNVCR